MKVKELIEKLQEQDQELEVGFIQYTLHSTAIIIIEDVEEVHDNNHLQTNIGSKVLKHFISLTHKI